VRLLVESANTKRREYINAKENFFSETVVHRAAIRGDLDTLQYLVEEGGDIRLKVRSCQANSRRFAEWQWEYECTARQLVKDNSSRLVIVFSVCVLLCCVYYSCVSLCS
jgi:hypothetical protein